MFIQATFPSSVADGTMVTPQLLIDLGYAWVLLVTLLAACCAILWFLSKPSGVSPPLRPLVRSSDTKTKRSGRFKPRPRGRGDFGTLPDPIPFRR